MADSAESNSRNAFERTTLSICEEEATIYLRFLSQVEKVRYTTKRQTQLNHFQFARFNVPQMNDTRRQGRFGTALVNPRSDHSNSYWIFYLFRNVTHLWADATTDPVAIGIEFITWKCALDDEEEEQNNIPKPIEERSTFMLI